MGVLNGLYYVVISTSILFLILNHAPNLLEFEPQAYTPLLLNYEGALAVNKDLDKAEIIMRGAVNAPESLVYKDGSIYASFGDGRVVLIKDEKVIKTVADTCKGVTGPCRPLGLRFYKEDLYVADIGRGLLKVDIKTGKIVVLLSTSQSVGGQKLSAPNDLDIDDEGVIYMSDVTRRWNYKNFFYGLLEHENTGRVIKYDIGTGKAEVLMDKVFGPNGIQLSHDKKSLLVSEFLNSRILRHYLQGTRKGQTEVFVNLPGEPNNIRINPRGAYWVPMFASRDASSPHLIDRLASYPKFRKAIARLSHLVGTGLSKVLEYWPSPVLQSISEELNSGSFFMMLWSTEHTVIVEINSEGKIIRSLHSQNPQLSSFSQVNEENGHLYIGSYKNSYLAKLKL